jgi:hypothetical protein
MITPSLDYRINFTGSDTESLLRLLQDLALVNPHSVENWQLTFLVPVNELDTWLSKSQIAAQLSD